MQLDRRSFLTGGAVLGASAALAGLAGCASKSQSDAPEAAATTWRTAPEPITDDQIVEVLDADVVVVGAGASGSIAAASAVEEGASVIVLQKHDTTYCHGWAWAANDTRLQAEANVSYDGWDVINHLNLKSENKAKGEVVRNWVKYSGETCDWIESIIKDVEGVGPMMLEIPEPADDDWNYTFTVTHMAVGTFGPTGSFPFVIDYLVNTWCDPSLIDVHYSTPAVQLRTDETGRVTGVIGQQADGSYILCNAAKGVILCAGDYGNDMEMRDEFMPYAVGLPAGYSCMDDTGDGHKMATWVGAAMEMEPHACNIHYDPEMRFPNYNGTIVPWLRVNANGERFSNEDVPYELIYAQDMRNPDKMHFQVWDANWETDWTDMGKGGAMRTVWTDWVPGAIEAGDIFVGNTIEELAEKMGVPADAFKATVDRYNELCDKGHDDDFGKQARRMKPVRKAPFYAIPRSASCLTPLGGLEVNGNFQVLNTEGQVIEGLYAAGNCSGNFFGGFVQRMECPGFGVGRAIVTGRVAAKRCVGAQY